MADGIERLQEDDAPSAAAEEVERGLASLDRLPLAEHVEVLRRLDGVILAELRALERL